MAKDIKKLISARLSKKGAVKVADIVEATGFSRAYVNRFFQEMKKDGKIALIGRANNAHYVLASDEEKAKKGVLFVKRILKNVNLLEDIVLDEVKKNSGIFSDLSKNVSNIVDYAFTEMLNNAIEHSCSKKIIIFINRNEKMINFEVTDFGVGIFKNIMKKRKLKNEIEAIQDLLKGKQTTAPKEHTGEGIFFTSKAADNLTVQGSNKKLIFDNIAKDVFIKDILDTKGTRVDFEISVKDYEYSTNTINFEILNTGEHDAEGLVVEIPKQENIDVKGSNKYIAGSLDANEDTSFSFEVIPKNGEIKLNIIYTDEINERRILEKSINFDSSYFWGRKKDEVVAKPISYYVAIGEFVLFVLIWLFSWLRRRRRRKNQLKYMKK
mgnify:CR=1 FL=1